MRKLILVFQFFTRIPIPSNSKASANNFGAAMKLLPVVGAAIGGMMWLTYRVLSPFDTLVASVAAVLLELVLTGGIHQDGLGDTFDGLFSNTNGQRMLDIMKDSRLGTHGVLAIVGVLLVKISVINALAEPCVLVAMPVFSRLAMVFGTALSGKSRGGGLGHLFISQVGPIDAVLSGLLSGVLAFYSIGVVMVIVAEIAALALALLFIVCFNRRIGCMTGDTLGALGEIYSIVFLAVYAVVKPYMI